MPNEDIAFLIICYHKLVCYVAEMSYNKKWGQNIPYVYSFLIKRRECCQFIQYDPHQPWKPTFIWPSLLPLRVFFPNW